MPPEPSSRVSVPGVCRRSDSYLIKQCEREAIMSDKIYDVVIVGAGIAGAILAKTLSKAGKTVLVLEAGDAIRGFEARRRGSLQGLPGIP